MNCCFLSKVLFAYFFSERKSKSVGVFLLEGSADCVCAGCCVAGAYVDRFRRAGGSAVVINAVGNVTNDAVIAFAGVLFIFVIHHFQKLLSVSLLIFCAACARFIRTYIRFIWEFFKNLEERDGSFRYR